jgi:hypothetical protein
MLVRYVLETYEVLDSPRVRGADVAGLLRRYGAGDVSVTTVDGDGGSTDFVRVALPGESGRAAGGSSPTLGIIGRLGGVGARPAQVGFVSDGDGALAVLAAACKLAAMRRQADSLPGDIIVTTQISPAAPIVPHQPVPFMSSAVDMATKNRHEVDPAMDAILSVDTTKGNRIVNTAGIAISPTVKQGYILPASPDLLDVAERVTGRPPVVLPLATQDITPYGNGLHHINSIATPATATAAPVAGVAITAESVIAGSATGATDLLSVEAAARFCVEAAKDFTRGRCRFFDSEEYGRLVALYGDMSVLQTPGRTSGARPP